MSATQISTTAKTALTAPMSPAMDMDAVRWYVLVLPEVHRGTTDVLQQVHRVWQRHGHQPFDYLAPQYTEMRKVRGQFKKVEAPLLYNYVFIHASVKTILEIKKVQPVCNFLPRVTTTQGVHYPYLTDEAMKNLMWVVQSYSNVLPIYIPAPDQLVKGDKVRINRGRFAGAVAEVVVTPGRGSRDVMVCLDNCFTVPLLGVSEQDYEIISFNKEGKHNYFQLGDTQLMGELFEALCAMHRGEAGDEQTRVAQGAIDKFAHMTDVETQIMRVRLYCFLLPAYKILGRESDFQAIYSLLLSIEKNLTAKKIQPLLHLTLYACTDSIVWHRKAHDSIAPLADSTRKQDTFLLTHLAAFDHEYGHEGVDF